MKICIKADIQVQGWAAPHYTHITHNAHISDPQQHGADVGTRPPMTSFVQGEKRKVKYLHQNSRGIKSIKKWLCGGFYKSKEKGQSEIWGGPVNSPIITHTQKNCPSSSTPPSPKKVTCIPPTWNLDTK